MAEVSTAPDERGELLRETAASVVRLVLGFLAFVVVLALVAWAFHDELQRIGHWFVGRFGLAGMAAGAFLADGFHFPIPPQFYLLTGVTSGGSQLASVTSVLVGSVLGGLAAFTIGRRASKVPLLQRVAAAPGRIVEALVARHGSWGLVIAGLLPISYWLVCSAGGLLRLPYRAYGVFALMRIPRILVSYALIVLAWKNAG